MAAKKKIFWISIIGILLLTGLATGLNPVSAQNGTILAVDPAQVDLPLGNQVQHNLIVRNGVNVNEFDVTVTYDAQRLSLEAWVHGGFLDNVSCLHMINEPGVLELACTQVARPGVSGDGVLLQLFFDTLELGAADVIISDAEFADPQGVKTYPERQHGLVNILSDPTYTPTPTHTHTLVVTATALDTITPTFQPTASSTLTVIPTSTATSTEVITVPATRTPTLEIATRAVTRDNAVTEGLGENPQLRWPAGTATPEMDGSDLEPGSTDKTLDSSSVENDQDLAGDVQRSSGWVRLLWGLLIVSAAAIITIVIIASRRRPIKSEGNLL